MSGQDKVILTVRKQLLRYPRNMRSLNHAVNPLYGPNLNGQDGWISAMIICNVFKEFHCVLLHKHAKREPGQYSATLTTLLVNQATTTDID